MSVTESLQGRSLGELLNICNSHPALPGRTFFVGKDSKGENRKISGGEQRQRKEGGDNYLGAIASQ